MSQQGGDKYDYKFHAGFSAVLYSESSSSNWDGVEAAAGLDNYV
jgi:hypothetical protein